MHGRGRGPRNHGPRWHVAIRQRLLCRLLRAQTPVVRRQKYLRAIPGTRRHLARSHPYRRRHARNLYRPWVPRPPTLTDQKRPLDMECLSVSHQAPRQPRRRSPNRPHDREEGELDLACVARAILPAAFDFGFVLLTLIWPLLSSTRLTRVDSLPGTSRHSHP